MSGGQSISPLGNIGLGSTGAYSSYDPLMMSMMGSYGGYGMNPAAMMTGGYGAGMMNPMMGMYGGSFVAQQMEAMKEIYKMQEDLEKQRLEHATEMHKQQQLAEVTNLSSHDQAFFLKAMKDGYIQQGIREIYDAIRNGNQDYVVQKFYELKQGILNNPEYSEYLNDKKGGINSKENINNYIRLLYSEIAGGYTPGAPKPDLIDDIKTYGENPFWHGFNKTWLGNSGHNKLNAEEALNQMFGTGINDKGSKEKAEWLGCWGARAGETAAAGAAGFLGGATALGIAKFLIPEIVTKHIPTGVATNSFVKWGTKFKTWGKIGLIGAIIADVAWQMARD